MARLVEFIDQAGTPTAVNPARVVRIIPANARGQDQTRIQFSAMSFVVVIGEYAEVLKKLNG